MKPWPQASGHLQGLPNISIRNAVIPNAHLLFQEPWNQRIGRPTFRIVVT